MGKKKPNKDVMLKQYFSDKDRFVDVFNGALFNGVQVFRAEDLQDADSNVSAVRSAVFETKEGIVDILRKISLHGTSIDLGILVIEK